MSNHTDTLAPHLPVTVSVSERGAVLVEAATRVVAMSPYSERGTRLAINFGPGAHVLATDADVASLFADVVADLAATLDR
jgi:hypothetical protein